MTEQQVFLKKEVITRDDLAAIRNGYAYLANNTDDELARYQWAIAAGACQQIIDYLDRGKTTKEETND